MKKFLIIDGNSIMNRAFYGLSGSKMLKSSYGFYTNAIYGFLSTYWMIYDQINPDYVAVSFDLKAPTFRHKMYEAYKGTRKKMPDELFEQMPIIKEVLNAMNIPILELEGYEADDILGTVSNTNTSKGIFTYILTGDKDSFQLISDMTSIIIPITKMGKTEYTIYTPELLNETFNILPSQVTDVKALMGDASDNIPGVKGVGEKTAYFLIHNYKNIENIYDNIKTVDVTYKIQEKLINDKEMAFLSKKLATIDINVPIDLNYENAVVGEVNKQALFEVFKKLDFSKFMNKYDFSDVDKTASVDFDNEKFEVKETILVNSLNISVYLKDILNIFNSDLFSYLFSTNQVSNFSHVLGINKYILAIYSNVKDSIYIINLIDIKNNNLDLFNNIISEFANSKAVKLGYNIKQDILYLFSNGFRDINNFSFDIMVAYYLMDSNKSSYSIEYILKDLFHAEFDSSEVIAKNVQLSLFEEINEEREKEVYLAQNQIRNITIYLKGIYIAYNDIISKLKERDMLTLFEEVEMPLTETLAYMENVGMYIDISKLEEFSAEINNTLIKLEAQIYELAGETFNINSTQQLGNILFEKLNLPVVKKNKTGFSTDKAVLDELIEYHPIVELLIEYRQNTKLKSTFVDGIKAAIQSDGRVHTTFMQTVTSTGRLSSIEPNLQNIPIRSELGSKIREFFVGQYDNLIIDADYSQIELRVLAHISNDTNMIEAFSNKVDIHKVTASQVFGVDLSDVTSTMRSHAKAVNFGIVYGISDFGLARNIGTTRREAGKYIENYLNTYSGIHKFMDDIVVEAKEKGYVSTLFGRRRYIPEITNKNKNIVKFGERIAMNTPIQGSAADIIKIAMIKIYKFIKQNKLKSKLIMQVHDELLIEAAPEELDKLKEVMYDAMENVISLKVPLDIDLNIGKSWFEAK